jgi:hypothetical protein
MNGTTSSVQMSDESPFPPAAALPTIGSIADPLGHPATLNEFGSVPFFYTGNPHLPVDSYEPEWDEAYLMEFLPQV